MDEPERLLGAPPPLLHALHEILRKVFLDKLIFKTKIVLIDSLALEVGEERLAALGPHIRVSNPDYKCNVNIIFIISHNTTQLRWVRSATTLPLNRASFLAFFRCRIHIGFHTRRAARTRGRGRSAHALVSGADAPALTPALTTISAGNVLPRRRSVLSRRGSFLPLTGRKPFPTILLAPAARGRRSRIRQGLRRLHVRGASN